MRNVPLNLWEPSLYRVFLIIQTERDKMTISWSESSLQNSLHTVYLGVQLPMFVQPHFLISILSSISSSSPSRPAVLIRLLPLASSVLPPSSTLPPLPPPQGLSGYRASLIQTSWGFFHRANYRQLGAQRITFSVQGKAGASGERVVLWNTQIPDREGREVCVFVL